MTADELRALWDRFQQAQRTRDELARQLVAAMGSALGVGGVPAPLPPSVPQRRALGAAQAVPVAPEGRPFAWQAIEGCVKANPRACVGVQTVRKAHPHLSLEVINSTFARMVKAGVLKEVRLGTYAPAAGPSFPDVLKAAVATKPRAGRPPGHRGETVVGVDKLLAIKGPINIASAMAATPGASNRVAHGRLAYLAKIGLLRRLGRGAYEVAATATRPSANPPKRRVGPGQRSEFTQRLLALRGTIDSDRASVVLETTPKNASMRLSEMCRLGLLERVDKGKYRVKAPTNGTPAAPAVDLPNR